MRMNLIACGVAVYVALCCVGQAGDAPPAAAPSAPEAGTSDVQKRMAVFEKSLQANPENVELMLTLARGYGEAGQLETAQDYAKRAEIVSPTNSAVQHVLGNLACLQSDFDAAIRHFRDADPESRNAAIQLNLSLALLEKGQLEEARVAFKHATELDPSVSASYSDIARQLNVSAEAGR